MEAEEGKQSLTSLNLNEELQATAALYALGAIGQREARAFENHLATAAPELTQDLAAFEAVVAALALGADEQTPAPAVRQRLLARIAAEAEPASGRASQDRVPFINLRADHGHWIKMGPGLEFKQLFKDRANGTVTTLLKLAPGAEIPRHRHHGPEQCYILEGDFHVNELHLTAGDFHVALPNSVHETIGSQTGALVLIVAPENYEPL